MASPAKGWNAYKQDVCTYTQVPVPSRKEITCEKRENQQNARVKTGFKANGLVCSEPTKNYD